MPPKTIDLSTKLSAFSDLWQPKIIAQLNDYHLKLAKVEGDLFGTATRRPTSSFWS